MHTPRTDIKAARILLELGPNNNARFAAMCDFARKLELELITEDAFALAMAKHVPIQYWADTIALARRLMADPEEWRKLGQAPSIYLHNVNSLTP